MNKFLKICGVILIFAILVEFSPLIILAFIIAMVCGKGEGFKERFNNVIDKIKRMVNC